MNTRRCTIWSFISFETWTARIWFPGICPLHAVHCRSLRYMHLGFAFTVGPLGSWLQC